MAVTNVRTITTTQKPGVRRNSWRLVGLLLLLLFFSTFVSVTTAESDHLFSLQVTSTKGPLTTCSPFPQTLVVDIQAPTPFPTSLTLYRNDVINTDVPIYAVKRRPDGMMYFDPENPGTKDSASYQNVDEGAAFIFTCSDGNMELTGTMYVEGRKYRVSRVADQQQQQQQLYNPLLPPSNNYVIYQFQYVPVNAEPHYYYNIQLSERLTHTSTGNAPSQNSLLPEARDQRGSREKRDVATKDYFIDVLAWLDYSFYQYWLKREGENQTQAMISARKYIAYIFNDVNARFASFRGSSNSSFNLQIHLSSIIISKTAQESDWIEKRKEVSGGKTLLGATAALNATQAFVKANYSSLPRHDHFMLFTEYDLYGNDNGFRFNNTAGFAFVNTTCMTDGNSVSIVEDHGGFQSETTVAHELGHSLGAVHDGQGNNCNSADRYIMSGEYHPETEATKKNPWIFSPCSKADIEKYFQSLIAEGYESSCLLNRVNGTNVPEVTGLAGQFVGPDEQCRQIYGPESYLCRGSKFGAPEDVCATMYCKDPSTASQCTSNTAAPGTCCGQGKWCYNGGCVAAAGAKDCNPVATCPFGQKQGPVLQNATCNDLAAGYCYNTALQQICCEMCDRNHRNVQGCEYGDRLLGCNAAGCGRNLDDGTSYDVGCCGTCSYSTITPPRSTASITPSTTTVLSDIPGSVENICLDNAKINFDSKTYSCDQFLKLDQYGGRSHCYKPSVLSMCCRTCSTLKYPDKLCPYGDRENCTKLESRIIPCTSDLRSICCRTCNEVDNRIATSTKSSTSTTRSASSSSSTRPSSSSSLLSSSSSSNSTRLPTTKTATATATITKTTTTTATAVNKICVEVPGVITCGSSRVSVSVVLLLLGLMIGRFQWDQGYL